MKHLCFGRRQKIAVGRHKPDKNAIAKIEETALVVSADIGKNTEKLRHSEHENNVEIGKTAVDSIEKKQTAADKLIQTGIGSHHPSGVRKKFGKEKSNRNLACRKWNRGIDCRKMNVAKML